MAPKASKAAGGGLSLAGVRGPQAPEKIFDFCGVKVKISKENVWDKKKSVFLVQKTSKTSLSSDFSPSLSLPGSFLAPNPLSPWEYLYIIKTLTLKDNLKLTDYDPKDLQTF
jgi:hypothetical protein